MASQPRPEGALELLDRGPLNTAHRTEAVEQGTRASRTDPRQGEELRRQGPLAPARSVAADRKTMGLVSNLSQNKVRRIRTVEP